MGFGLKEGGDLSYGVHFWGNRIFKRKKPLIVWMHLPLIAISFKVLGICFEILMLKTLSSVGMTNQTKLHPFI